jgi:hypothetical protein
MTDTRQQSVNSFGIRIGLVGMAIIVLGCVS